MADAINESFFQQPGNITSVVKRLSRDNNTIPVLPLSQFH